MEHMRSTLYSILFNPIQSNAIRYTTKERNVECGRIYIYIYHDKGRFHVENLPRKFPV